MSQQDRQVDVTIVGKDTTKPAFDSAEKNASTMAGNIKNSILGPFNLIQAGIATALGSTLALFAKSSIDAAAAADAAWGRVESAVKSVGGNFGALRGQLDQLFTSISATTRYSQVDAADAFETLLRISHDYTGSIQQLSLATDVAAAKKIGLADAAVIVGKAMVGETNGFARMGIVLRSGETAMQALRREFNGFAETDSQTLQGRLEQVKNGWDKVKEAIGQALTGGVSGKNTLADELNGLSKWIDENKQGLEDTVRLVGLLAASLGGVVKQIPRLLLGPVAGTAYAANKAIVAYSDQDQRDASGLPSADSQAFSAQHQANIKTAAALADQRDKDGLQRIENAKKEQAAAEKARNEADAKHIADLKHEFDLLDTLSKLSKLSTDQKDRELAIEREIYNLYQNEGLSMTNRGAAAEFINKQRDEDLKKLRDAKKGLDLPLGFGYAVTGQAAADAGLRNVQLSGLTSSVPTPAVRLNRPTLGPENAANFGDHRTANAFSAVFGGDKAFDGVKKSLDSLSDTMKQFEGGTLANLFSSWQQGIQEVIQGHEALGVVLPRVMRRAVGASLAADGQDTMLRAAKAVALALTDPSGIHALQAAKLFAVGTAELSLAAGLSAGGGSGGGGYSGISSAGFSQTQSAISGGQGKVSVILNGSRIDFRNPDDLDQLAAMLRELGITRDFEFIVQGSNG